MNIFPPNLIVVYLALTCSAILKADDDLLPKPVMVNAVSGWWQKVDKGTSETLHTVDGGKTWQNVTPETVRQAVKRLPKDQQSDEFLGDLVCLDPLDTRKLWLAVPLADEKRMLVAYTDDEGQHWRQETVPVCDDAASISFPDERRGFLLATSFPALGHMDKQLFGTTDGGRHWQKLAVPPEGGYYARGFYFRTPQQGWIGGDYRGLDGVPLFRTDDGGQTWVRQPLEVPEVFAKLEHYYANTTHPDFDGPDLRHGTLMVHFRQHSDKPYFDADVEYQSGDGGKTWHLPTAVVKTIPSD